MLALIASLGFAQSKEEPPNTEQLKREALEKHEAERKTAWRDALRELGKTEKTAIVFDVRTDVVPPLGLSSPIGREGLALIADAYARQYQEIRGVQVFKRNLTAAGRPMTFNPAASLANFLAGMPQDLVHRMTEDGLPLSQVPHEKRWYLSLLRGEYPAMNAGTAAKDYSNTFIQLKAVPGYDYEDPNEKGKFITNRPVRPREVRDELSTDEAEKILAGSHPLENGAPYQPPPTGDLDFSEGEIMTLGEIVDKARATFEIGYLLDRRLASSLVFIMGSFDRETFEHVIRDFSRSPGLVPLLLDDRSAKDAMRSILEGPLSHLRSQDLSDYTDADLTVGDLADGKPVRLGDLLQGNQDQLAQLARLKLTPDTQVKAKVRLQISVNRVAKEGSGWKRIRGLPIGIVDGG
jgi:hypothetical protein